MRQNGGTLDAHTPTSHPVEKSIDDLLLLFVDLKGSLLQFLLQHEQA